MKVAVGDDGVCVGTYYVDWRCGAIHTHPQSPTAHLLLAKCTIH